MSQFRGSIQGKQGIATRLGSKRSGLKAHINGWRAGIYVQAEHVNGEDVFNVYLTSGSNPETRMKFIGKFTEKSMKDEY